VSPEFQRHLWMELSPYRLVAMPVVLAGFFLATLLYTAGGIGSDLGIVAIVLFMGMIFPWGNRLISDSLNNEIAGTTWDRQRMSAIGAWDMTWGKLAGSTIFVWYGGALCLAVLAVSLSGIWRPHDIAIAVAMMVLAGIFSHATCFLFTLLAVRRHRARGVVRAGLYQMVATALGGLLLGAVVWHGFDAGPPTTIRWFGQSLPLAGFLLLTVGLWCAWSVAGAVAVMRTEFQQNNPPWLWLGHMVFAMVYIAGIDLVPEVIARRVPWFPTGLFPAFCVAIAGTYITVLCEPKSRVPLRRLVHLLLRGDVVAVVRMLSHSALGVLLVGVSAAVILSTGDTVTSNGDRTHSANLNLFTLSIFFFVVRDIAIVLAVATLRPKSGERQAFLLLLLAYTAVPALASLTSLEGVLPFFWPIWGGEFLPSVLPPALEAMMATVILLVLHRNAGTGRQSHAD
jgi:hypothetical protein